jgi:hypothetical protein
MLTMQIQRVHLVILGAVLFVSLLLGCAVAGTVVGRALVSARAAPTRAAPRSFPGSNPVRYDNLFPSSAPIRLGPTCEEQWRAYQQQYTDYKTNGGHFAPIRPSC